MLFYGISSKSFVAFLRKIPLAKDCILNSSSLFAKFATLNSPSLCGVVALLFPLHFGGASPCFPSLCGGGWGWVTKTPLCEMSLFAEFAPL